MFTTCNIAQKKGATMETKVTVEQVENGYVLKSEFSDKYLNIAGAFGIESPDNQNTKIFNTED